MHLTKSLFVDYMTYPKLARWKANNSEIYKKIRKIETEEAEEHIIQIGQAVEDVVYKYLQHKYQSDVVDLMPRYKAITIETDDEDDNEYEAMITIATDISASMKNTLEAMQQWVRILYQPTFMVDDCIVRADFMIKNGDWYDLVEVKAKSWIRKEVTDNGEKKKIWSIDPKFINDVSFQSYVINKVLASNDMPLLKNVYFFYLNREYIKQWELDLVQLIREDQANTQAEIEVIQRNKPTKILVNDLLLDTASIEKTLQEMRKYLVLPEDEFNKICLRQWTKFLEYFGKDKIDMFGTIMWPWIHHSNASYIQDLYYQWRHNIADLTPEEIDWFNEWTQKFIAKYMTCKKSWQPIIDSDSIREVFSTFAYPICFYDYETISVPVPFLDNTRPYLQTVVQYSLHKYYEDWTMKHYGWVFVGEWEHNVEHVSIPHDPNLTDAENNKAITGSYKHLLEHMIADIGEDLHKGTFVVRYEWFENSRNKEIAKLFPDLADAYLHINDNTFDLMKIVSEWKYFDTKFKWSASIKKVMPVLAPTMDYSTLDIGRWDKAMRELHNIISWKKPTEDRQKTIEDLLIYCGQDTMAMVKIYEAIKRVI